VSWDEQAIGRSRHGEAGGGCCAFNQHPRATRDGRMGQERGRPSDGSTADGGDGEQQPERHASSASHLQADDDWEEGRRRTGPARARSAQRTTIAETPGHVHVARLEEHRRDRTTQRDSCAKVPRKGGFGTVRGGEKAGRPFRHGDSGVVGAHPAQHVGSYLRTGWKWVGHIDIDAQELGFRVDRSPRCRLIDRPELIVRVVHPVADVHTEADGDGARPEGSEPHNLRTGFEAPEGA